LRSGEAAAAAAADRRRRRGLPRRAERLPRARRPELLGACTVTTTETPSSRPEARPAKAPGGTRFVNWASNYIDERTSISGAVREFGRKIFPDHWSFMLGEVALYSFIVILLSGT